MQTLLTSVQLQAVDAHTVKQQGISSVDLMENAASAFVAVFKKQVSTKTSSIAILCGQGNNGGDGLAIARLLYEEGYKNLAVYLINFSVHQSVDYQHNLQRLTKTRIKTLPIKTPDEIKEIPADLIIDAVLGSGLNRPLADKYAVLANHINQLKKRVIAVDVPTGFNAEGPMAENYNGIKADLVIVFQRPKINFFMPESANALAKFKVVPIGLDEDFIESQSSNWKLTTITDIKDLIKIRENFSHKGTYGHALLVAGNNATMGAALLAANACLHAGAGLTTVCLPQSGFGALNTALPEIMALPRNEDLTIAVLEKFSAIAIGPGLGITKESEEILEKLIQLKKPLLLDADALTIVSKRIDLLDELVPQSILTPHIKEFDRLFGTHQTWWERIATAKKQAEKRGLVILLKNQYTFVCLPNGEIHINPTGNPAMASGGMGDVLTGIIAGLLAQSYSSANAAILAAYLHGKAGDELAKKKFTVNASQIALRIPKTIKKIMPNQP